MRIKFDEHLFEKYTGEELEKAKQVYENLKESAAALETSVSYNLSLAELEVLEKLADQYDAPDTDLFYIYCQGFARGREYEKAKQAKLQQ